MEEGGFKTEGAPSEGAPQRVVLGQRVLPQRVVLRLRVVPQRVVFRQRVVFMLPQRVVTVLPQRVVIRQRIFLRMCFSDSGCVRECS